MQKLFEVWHVSRHIAWASFGLLLGVSLASFLPTSFTRSPAWLVLAVCVAAFVLLKRWVWLASLALLAGLLAGLYRGGAELASYQPLWQLVGQAVEVRGTLAEDPTNDQDGTVRVVLQSLTHEGAVLSGKAWVSLASRPALQRGDQLVVSGKLGEGFGSWQASMYRAEVRRITHQTGDPALVVRDWFTKAVSLAIPQPEASLGTGFLVGQQISLPAELEDQLKIVGLTHIIVASGYNLTILVQLARRLLAGTSKYLATLAGANLIAGFIAITGLSPSMTRAGLVAGLGLAVWYYGRAFHPLVLLPCAAAVTVVANPAFLWGDVGWYLSFLAFAGVLLLAPLVHAYFWGEAKASAIRSTMVETLCAQVITLPLILHLFGNLALYALPANLLVLPLVPLTMLCTFVAGLIAGFAPPLAGLAGLPASVILQYMTGVVEWLANLPGAQVEVAFPLWAMTGSYLLIVLFTTFIWWRTRYDFGQPLE